MSHLGTTAPEIRQSSTASVLNILMLQEMSKEGRQALAYWLLIESKVRSVIDEQHYYANYLMKPKDVLCFLPFFQVNINQNICSTFTTTQKAFWRKLYGAQVGPPLLRAPGVSAVISGMGTNLNSVECDDTRGYLL